MLKVVTEVVTQLEADMTIETLTIAGAFDDDIFARPPRGLAVQPAPEPTPIEPTDLFTSHTRACATCGAEFQTCGKGKRCSRCLVGPGEADKDVRIVCRVCAAQATVAVDWPALLCEHCIENLDQTRARVADWLGSALVRLDAIAGQQSRGR